MRAFGFALRDQAYFIFFFFSFIFFNGIFYPVSFTFVALLYYLIRVSLLFCCEIFWCAYYLFLSSFFLRPCTNIAGTDEWVHTITCATIIIHLIVWGCVTLLPVSDNNNTFGCRNTWCLVCSCVHYFHYLCSMKKFAMHKMGKREKKIFNQMTKIPLFACYVRLVSWSHNTCVQCTQYTAHTAHMNTNTQ